MFWMAKQWIDFLVCQRERNTYLWGLTKVHYFLFQKFYTWVTAKLIIKLVNFAISHKWSLCFSLWPINFQGKKWEGKIILKCILLWLEILFGRWLGMKQGQHWWKLAQMYCCVGNVLNSWLFSLTKLTIWLLGFTKSSGNCASAYCLSNKLSVLYKPALYPEHSNVTFLLLWQGVSSSIKCDVLNVVNFRFIRCMPEP